jgi:hypothetical protein
MDNDPWTHPDPQPAEFDAELDQVRPGEVVSDLLRSASWPTSGGHFGRAFAGFGTFRCDRGLDRGGRDRGRVAGWRRGRGDPEHMFIGVTNGAGSFAVVTPPLADGATASFAA